jgi:DNA-binding IclR family transcriptional regulator
MLSTVERAIQMMASLGVHPEGMTLSELAREIGSNKQAVFRLAKTLAAFQFVANDQRSGKLRLGLGLSRLADAARSELDLRQIALPELTKLRDQTGETACLHVMFGYQRMCIAQVESQDELRWVADVGKPFPLSGAPGRVFLAFLPEKDGVRLRAASAVKSPKSMENLPPHDWEREVAKVRRNGYAIARNETVSGVSSISAPIVDTSGRAIAAVTIIGPSQRLPPDRLQAQAEKVRESAGQISNTLSQANNYPSRSRGPVQPPRTRGTR